MSARKVLKKQDKSVLIEAFAEMARERGIDREALQEIIKETLSMLALKKYGQEANFEIVVNMDKGDIEIYWIREIVEVVENAQTQITLADANFNSAEKLEIGEDYIQEVTLDNIAESFGRRLITVAGQTLSQRVRDVNREQVIKAYTEKTKEIIIGEVHYVQRADVIVMHSGVELRLPREEQIPRERYRKGDAIRCLVKEIRRPATGGSPDIILSRSDNDFLRRLFEIEIPEIYDGIIAIKAIAREPGERAKVAVQSFDDRIDPVGACVGMKGTRIHAIVRELNNENIDVINYSEDPITFITRALSPAKVKEIEVMPDTRSVRVTVADDQVSLAIGKNGQNVRLANRLTGYAISIIKEGGSDDIELIEFKDELGGDLYTKLIEAGIDTAREFLKADVQLLQDTAGMSADLILEMRKIMLEEFDEEESDDVREQLYAQRENEQKDATGDDLPDAIAQEVAEEMEAAIVATEDVEDNRGEIASADSELDGSSSDTSISDDADEHSEQE
jgi:N utilization substance protein A